MCSFFCSIKYRIVLKICFYFIAFSHYPDLFFLSIIVWFKVQIMYYLFRKVHKHSLCGKQRFSLNNRITERTEDILLDYIQTFSGDKRNSLELDVQQQTNNRKSSSVSIFSVMSFNYMPLPVWIVYFSNIVWLGGKSYVRRHSPKLIHWYIGYKHQIIMYSNARVLVLCLMILYCMI